MSALFIETTDNLDVTTNIIQGNSNFSICGWIYIDSASPAPDYQSIWVKYDAAFSAYIELYAYDDAMGDTFLQMDVNNGGGALNTDFQIQKDRWYFVGIRKAGNVHGLIVNNAQTGTVTLNMTGVVYGNQTLGYDGFSVNGWFMRSYREWAADIGSGNFTAEGKSSVVVRTANLQRNCPLITDANDISGNGFNWTNNGVTFDASTPYPAANVDPTNAIDIGDLSTPYQQVVDANPSTLFAFDLWWKITVPADMIAFSAFGRSGNYAVNRSDVDFWETPGATTGASTSSEDNYPIVTTTLTQGDLHYVSAVPSSRTATPYVLTMDIEAAPTEAASVGDIFSNDDQPDRPAVVASSTVNYEIKRYVDVPSGESGDIILNGNMLIGDRYTPAMVLFDSDFVQLASFTGNHGGNHSRGIRANRLTSKFYFVRNGNSGSNAIIDRVDGITIDLTFTITGTTGISLGSIMPNLADTVLYHSAATAGPIVGWDIPGNASLGTIVATVASRQIIDMLALADGTFAVLRLATLNGYLYHYNSAWSLLATYDLGPATALAVPPRMSWALDDPTSVWVKIFRTDLGDPIITEFRNVRLSDGATLGDVFHATFFDGAYTPELFDGSEPVAVFGIPSSCPFWILPGDVPPPTGCPDVSQLVDASEDVALVSTPTRSFSR